MNVLSGKFDTLGISEEAKDALGERLTQLSWESDQTQQIIDGKRGVYEMLGLHYVAPKEAPKVIGRGKPVTDELDSYETLVKEAGTNLSCRFDCFVRLFPCNFNLLCRLLVWPLLYWNGI